MPILSNITGNGAAFVNLTATLKNGGTPVTAADGFTITFTSDDGTLDILSATTSGGKAIVKLTSAAARIIHGTPNVHATWTEGPTTLTADATVDYSPGPSSQVTVWADDNIVLTGGATTKVYAQVVDSGGDPISNLAVDFSPSMTFPSSPVYTNSSGVATIDFVSTSYESLIPATATAQDADESPAEPTPFRRNGHGMVRPRGRLDTRAAGVHRLCAPARLRAEVPPT